MSHRDAIEYLLGVPGVYETLMRKPIALAGIVSLTALAFALAPAAAQAGDFTRLQRTAHVTGEECTLFLDTKAVFPRGSELSASGGAGSDGELEKRSLLLPLIRDRGYRLVTDERHAEFKLEIENGIQCVLTDRVPSGIAAWALKNFDTEHYASGRFTGKLVDGETVENSAHRTFRGWGKEKSLKKMVGKILSYCRKSR